MPLMNLVILALIQGITEFLPISSSGHLALFPALSGEADQGLSIDVAVHVGTLVAVVIFFWTDVRAAVVGGLQVLTGKVSSYEAGLALRLVVATVPVVIAGLILSAAGLTDIFRNVEIIAWATIVFGVVLYIADRFGPLVREAEDWTWRDAIVMGLAQAVALGAAAFSMQDILLEPFGGEILELSVAATTVLTALFAGGALGES